MVIVGIDFGDARTGIAVCDKYEMMASEAGCVAADSYKKALAAVGARVKELGAELIVVGNPINMDGSHGPRAEHAEKFARILGEILAEDEVTSSLPIVMMDERMTTMAASRYLNETDTRGQKRKQVIDTLSAQIILQNALDRLKNMM